MFILAQAEHSMLSFCPRGGRVDRGQAVQSPHTFTFWASTKCSQHRITAQKSLMALGFPAFLMQWGGYQIPLSALPGHSTFLLPVVGTGSAVNVPQSLSIQRSRVEALGTLAAPCYQRNYLLWDFLCTLIPAWPHLWACSSKAKRLLGIISSVRQLRLPHLFLPWLACAAPCKRRVCADLTPQSPWHWWGGAAQTLDWGSEGLQCLSAAGWGPQLCVSACSTDLTSAGCFCSLFPSK